MNIRRTLLLSAVAMLASGAAGAVDYTTLVLEKSVDRPAEAVWKKVGDFCALRDWMKVTCEITSGSGDVGTVRHVAGRIDEVMVAKTPLSYTYTFPAPTDLYHGTVQVVPEGPQRSKLIYTMFYDQEPLKTPEAKAESRESRAERFTGALDNMKAMAEAK